MLQTILTIILVITSVVMIVSIVMQDSNSSGVSSIMGGTDTYFGKGKAKGRQAKLAMITKITATIFMVLCILLVVFFD